MTGHFRNFIVFSLILSPTLAVQAGDDQPAGAASKVSADAKAVGSAVKRDAKVVAGAAKDGAQQVAAAAKRGAEKTKAAIKPEKAANKSDDKSDQ